MYMIDNDCQCLDTIVLSGLVYRFGKMKSVVTVLCLFEIDVPYMKRLQKYSYVK
jgi:predicted ribonuclease YlaK